MEALKLTADELIEVLSTYTATEQAIPAVGTTPGWYVVGAFRMRATLDVVMAGVLCVSHSSLTIRSRLFDVTDRVPVAIELATQSTVDAYVQSGAAELEGLHIYQMQIEVTGNAGENFFGSVKSISLIAAEV